MSNVADSEWSQASKLALRATENAAIACYPWIGKNDKIAADAAAVKAITQALEDSVLRFNIVIGEGELDNAPMLNIGDMIGNDSGIQFDVAVDPLEGTGLCSLGLHGSVSALAFGQQGTLLSAPDSYMMKLMAGPSCPDHLVDVDLPLADIICGYADAVGKKVGDVTVCILDKPRHQDAIEKITTSGAKIFAIPDADIPAALWVCDPEGSGVDLYWGVGGGPEGVISACALACLGGKMSARFAPQNEEQSIRLHQFNNALAEKKFNLSDIVRGDTIFSMSSITGSHRMASLKIVDGKIAVDSILLSSRPI